MPFIKYNYNNSWRLIGEVFWPIGSIYLYYATSSNPGTHTDDTYNIPANAFGGSWAKLDDNKVLAILNSGNSAPYTATKHTHYYSLGYSAYYGSLIGPDLGAISLYDYDGAHGGDHLGGYWTKGINDISQAQPKNNGLVGGSTYTDSVRIRHEAAVSGTQLTTDQLPRITVWGWRKVN